ncbi:LysR family transcriptional regulator [Vibrio sinaloensis]|uniref:LysR family transcriptional regulator n=1 Tax=Photobacterium sp. (strain ATCC 43367) TaxID=379097 RepID=UPI0022AED4EB|nr:LysR family transcriptional regulator [Vibrio sinaloensis]MCZ4294993.1 LysR family transcriptional regulator [Vibrio sinaloensis]
MFSIEQLSAFTATVETGSFSAAARKLNKVQSAVSQHVMNLEIDCGTELFHRQGRYPVLTEAGKQLLPHANATLRQHQRLIECSNSLLAPQEQAITIAIDEGIPLANFTGVLEQVTSQYTDLKVEILVSSSTDILDMVTEKRATTGLIFSEINTPACIDFESIGHVEFDLYVSQKHPLAMQTSANVDQLLLHRQLLLRSRNNKVSGFQQAYSPDIWYADSYHVLLGLIAQGFGWGFLPTHIAANACEENQIKRIPIEFEQLQWQANVDVVQHQGFASKPVHKLLRTELRTLLSGTK